MSSSQICHVIFPGAFKPVHYGHIALMQKYLNSTEYAVKLTVLVSRGERDGLKPEASKWFLEQVFKGNLNFDVEIFLSKQRFYVAALTVVTVKFRIVDGNESKCFCPRNGFFRFLD